MLQVNAQSMTDDQVLKEAVAAKKQGLSETDIASRLLKKGATMAQIQKMRRQYAGQITKQGLDSNVDNAISNVQDRMRTNHESNDNDIVTHEGADAPTYVAPVEPAATMGKKVFGRDIFNNKALTFEPQMNIATPQNYVVGPGDQIIIDVYGDTQKSVQLQVSPDGDVVVPDYGPIRVSGLSVAQAQQRIRSALGTYYASSEVKVTLGQTRTIMVNVMGEVKVPGTYTLSAFATVFHALYMAGGINDLGTLRSIKVFRQGRQISVVDIYEFILNGRLAGNVRLQDNDVIQVGPYESIVDITGRVKRPMAYELRKNESLSTLLKYSGGFANDAYKKSLRVLRKNGRMKSVFNVEEFEMADFKMFDGDSVSVDSIIDRFENMVEVKGAVFRPGMYHLGEKVHSVRSLIENADGLTEEAMVSRAVMRRMKPNRTQEVVSIDLKGIMEGTSADVRVYEYAEKMTIEDLILQAGGLTDKASTAKVDVARRMIDPAATTSTMDIAKTFSFSINPGF